MLPTLAELVKTVTPANALSNILSIAHGLGLSTTSWGPFGMVITILETMSEVVAQGSVDVANIAQGRFISTACAMVDTNGNPVTSWARLAASEDYGVTFVDAVPAEGMVALGNTLAISRGPYAAGALHLKHPTTGATYTSTAAVTIAAAVSPPSATYTLSEFVADAAYTGTLGTAVPGIVLAMTTPIPGVSCAALGSNGSSDGLVGTDAESNPHLLARCIAKIGSIAPNGAAGALTYVATTPEFAALYGTLSAPVTRAETSLDTTTGTVTVTIANASGGPVAGDVAIIQQACQNWATPTGMTCIVQAAGDQAIVVAALIYVTGVAGTLATAAAAAVTEYFANIPIGGTNLAINGVVPISGILAAIQSCGTGQITGINLASPLINVVMGSTDVPTLDPSSTFTVIVVATP